MTTLLTIAIALGAGLLMTRLVKPLKLPAVTAYLVAGVLVGPYCLGRLGIPGIGFISTENVDQFSLISNVALGFIAFAIGNEFRLSQLRKTGKQATVIGIIQALVAALLVDIALIILSFILKDQLSVASAITLGAIATATAPAATLMVVKQYKAKGKLTDILLPVVALDDAVGLIVFAVSFGVACAMQNGTFDLQSILLEPMLEILLSLLLGAVMGWLLTQLEKLFNSNSNRLSLTVCFVFLTVALAMAEFDLGSIHISFSSLLVCMMCGTIFCNLSPLSHDIMDRADRWTAPLNALFFVISGAALELGVFSQISVVIIGIVYILFRSLGKYIGAYGSCKLVHADPVVTKNLGITLLPQAGVALGMCVTVSAKMGEAGDMIRNIILFSVLIYELIGPSLTKRALIRSGDIVPKSDEVINRRDESIKAGEKLKEEHKSR